ncbi:ketoreductase [Aspergillus ustus]|uniref:Ketoreductase n=1 Tax=Aspergillus ustus TaxID=40382 RepID=A0A0C1BVU6_ASPUT|nr:ketoreductase [Aspergillus ustus]
MTALPPPTSGLNTPARKTTYLVTGASRGLGKGLVATFLLRPGSTVIAGVRNPTTQRGPLDELPVAEDSSLIVVKLDCASKTDALDAVRTLQTEHGIAHLDVVIANAAIAANYGPASTMPLEYLEEHMQVNAYAVLLLFQATRVLLQAAVEKTSSISTSSPSQDGGKQQPSPQFICVGAPISTITDMESCARAPLTNYALSKLAACYLVRKFHFENNWLLAWIVDPGHIQSDMGAQAARLFGRKEAPTTIDESVAGVCTRMAEARKETTSGRFVLFEDGSDVAW